VNPEPDPGSFLSGEIGSVVGPRLRVIRTAADLGQEAARALSLTGPRLGRLARQQAPRSVLVLSVYRAGSRLVESIDALRSKTHEVHFAFGSIGPADPALAAETQATEMEGGKFQNLNALMAAGPDAAAQDWLLVVDDDVRLPHRFLDRYIALLERLGLDLAQPAQTMRSHAAWRVTRRRAWSLGRETNYVEIGPVTAFSGRVAGELTPFPELRYGWGLDNHWGAIARERGWSLGVVDALAVRHTDRHVASDYSHAEAVAEARSFLSERSFVTTDEAQRTLVTHRRL